MNVFRFVTGRINSSVSGDSDFSISAKGSISVNRADADYALNLQGSIGDSHKAIVHGGISLATKNARGPGFFSVLSVPGLTARWFSIVTARRLRSR